MIVGVFYLAAAGFNAAYTLPRASDADLFEGYADGAWLSSLEELVREVFIPNAALLMAIVVVFEVAVGLALLGRGAWVDAGAAASLIWVAAILPFLAWPYLVVNVVLAGAQGIVATRRYEATAWDVARGVAHRAARR